MSLCLYAEPLIGRGLEERATLVSDVALMVMVMRPSLVIAAKGVFCEDFGLLSVMTTL